MTPTRWREIERVYHAALERPPADRDAFLAEACKTDPKLRREVESLLAQDASKTGTLDRPAWALVSPSDGSMTPITPGSQLGPYKIEGPLGEGGMGEVFRGVDTRLGRSVAVKISREQFSARFEREARAISSLNHPNICTLYDVGPNYLVMELCEGETLAARLELGKLSIQETLRYGAQIADALAAAHAKGIVHRDLKPGNVILTKAGVKVLDFGLAKSAQDETLTASHVVMGTPAYMAPEQREGKECDARTDIYALGLILYEMASGKRWQHDQPAPLDPFPIAFAHVVDRCLQRDPEDRWQSARDVQRELEWAETSRTDAPPVTVRRRINFLPWSIAAALAVSLASIALLHFRVTPPTLPALRLSLPLPQNQPVGYLALSPDGRRLVIGLSIQGRVGLWLRSLDSPGLLFLPGTEGARSQFWSPDSRFIGFFDNGTLKTMPAAGGPPQVLCDGTGFSGGGTWNRDGVILFGSDVGPLRRVNAAGGACTVVTRPEGDSQQSLPEFIPDGKHFVYLVQGGDEAKRGLYVASLDHPEPRRLLADESSAIFASSTTGKKYGYLLFLRGNTLMAQPFSAETLQLAGDAFPVVSDASSSFNLSQIAASVSAGGILVYERDIGFKMQLTWLDRSGKELGKVGTVQNFSVALSPDGNTVATVRANQTIASQAIWLYDMQRGGETRFTSPPLTGSAPVWSPEGSKIAFGSGKRLFLKDATGGSKEDLLLENESFKAPSDWSRDGRYLVYTETDHNGKIDIWFLQDPLNKSSDWKPLMFQSGSQGQISPDGHWLAYTSLESGQAEVYVRPFPSGPGRWKVSVGRGFVNHEPRWRRDGKELFFLESLVPNNRLMAVSVQTGHHDDVQVGAPRALFEFRAIYPVPSRNWFLYSPTADGQRFLVSAQPVDAEPKLTVITNWEKAALGDK
jgi:serine/threonine protein kinase